MKIKNIIVYVVAAVAIVGLVYYLFLLPKSNPGDTSVGKFKSIYGY